MKSNIFIYTRFALALFTVAVLLLFPHIPPRSQLIHPLPVTTVTIQGHQDPVRGDSTVWIDEEAHEWRCDYRAEYGHNLTCGFTLSWGSTFNTSVNKKDGFPACQDPDSDPDGDGWGWENEQSCIVASATVATRKTGEDGNPEYSECRYASSDEDGDGWGWENGQSCIITRASISTPAPMQVREVQPQQPLVEQVPVCENAATDDDGDGWGWENERSCIVADEGGLMSAVSSADFSRFDSLLVELYYEGRARSMRVYLRNFNPAYATPGDLDSTKFMSVPIRTEDLKVGPVKIRLDEFRVDEWWINERNAPRKWIGTELDAIVVFGMDLAEFGVHKVRVERVELLGNWIERDTLLIILVVGWCVYLLFEGFLRYIGLYQAAHRSEQRINQLTGINSALQQQKHTLKSLSTIDSLTGVNNREGLARQVSALPPAPEGKQSGVLMLDIDHFKRINDSFGHDVGDMILKDFVDVIRAQIRDKDIVARWGGEEFLVVSPATVSYKLMNLAEKIRLAVEQHSFNQREELRVTVSIGATMLRVGESYEQAYSRADNALYKAKNGRNRVEFEV